MLALQRFPRRVVPQREPHHDMALAATVVFFGLFPLAMVAALLGFEAMGALIR